MGGRALREQGGHVAAGEFPFEGFGRRFPIVLKIEQTLGECLQAREGVGRENLPLNDGKVDFDLVEPIGVNGPMDKRKAPELVCRRAMEAAPACAELLWAIQ